MVGNAMNNTYNFCYWFTSTILLYWMDSAPTSSSEAPTCTEPRKLQENLKARILVRRKFPKQQSLQAKLKDVQCMIYDIWKSAATLSWAPLRQASCNVFMHSDPAAYKIRGSCHSGFYAFYRISLNGELKKHKDMKIDLIFQGLLQLWAIAKRGPYDWCTEISWM